MWNPKSWALESGIQLKESRIPLVRWPKVSQQFQFVDGNFNFTHGNFNLIVLGNFNFTHGNFNLLTAISIYSQQFQFYARQIQFTYENTEITVSKIEISPLHVSIHVVQNWQIGTQKSHWGKTNKRHV